MKYRRYKKTIQRVNNKETLDKILSFAEKDMELSDAAYFQVKTLINKRIYAIWIENEC